MNPYQAPETMAQVPEVRDDREKLRRIASAQRQINVLILLYFVSIILLAVFPSNRPEVMAIGIVGGVLLLAIAIWGIIAIFKLAMELRGTAVAIFYSVGMLIPLLGLLLLVSINGQATRMLQKAGIKVGLLGANVSGI